MTEGKLSIQKGDLVMIVHAHCVQCDTHELGIIRTVLDIADLRGCLLNWLRKIEPPSQKVETEQEIMA